MYIFNDLKTHIFIKIGEIQEQVYKLSQVHICQLYFIDISNNLSAYKVKRGMFFFVE